MISMPKNMYIDKLDDIVDKYNNKYHSTIKIKPADAKSAISIDIDKKNNRENPKFNVDNHVRISKYRKFFAKGYVPN